MGEKDEQLENNDESATHRAQWRRTEVVAPVAASRVSGAAAGAANAIVTNAIKSRKRASS